VKEQSPAASPPTHEINKTQKAVKKKMESQTHSAMTSEQENHIKCEIKDIHEFKWCLDSVKFPTGPKKFNVSENFPQFPPFLSDCNIYV
jgi:hypothetical protein